MENLRQLLKKKRIPQIEVAELLMAHPSQICLWVRGTTKIPEKHLKKLSEILDIKLDDLKKIININAKYRVK